MFDFLGKKLVIGDKVVLMQPHYKNFIKGVVQSITPKRVKIMFFNPIYKEEEFIYKYPDNVIKYE